MEQQRERRGFGDNQRSRGAPRGGPRRRGQQRRPDRNTPTWTPVTKLGRLVKAGLITSLEQIYLHALPVKVISFLKYLKLL